jgi:hypothetical protein
MKPIGLRGFGSDGLAWSAALLVKNLFFTVILVSLQS